MMDTTLFVFLYCFAWAGGVLTGLWIGGPLFHSMYLKRLKTFRGDA